MQQPQPKNQGFACGACLRNQKALEKTNGGLDQLAKSPVAIRAVTLFFLLVSKLDVIFGQLFICELYKLAAEAEFLFWFVFGVLIVCILTYIVGTLYLELQELEQTIVDQRQELQEKQSTITAKQSTINQHHSKIAGQDQTINRLKRSIADAEREAGELKAARMAFTRVSRSCAESYSDRGTGAKQDVSVWRPRLNQGEFCIMYACTNSRSFKESVCCIKDPGCDVLKPPTHFECIWTDRSTGGAKDGQLWAAIPPPGYVALSDVAIHRSNAGLEPHVTRPAAEIDPDFRCVHRDLVKSTSVGRCIWTDAGSGGKYDGACWAIRDSQGFRASRGGPTSYTGNKPPPAEQWRLA
jgi:hypothetical protein